MLKSSIRLIAPLTGQEDDTLRMVTLKRWRPNEGPMCFFFEHSQETVLGCRESESRLKSLMGSLTPSSDFNSLHRLD